MTKEKVAILLGNDVISKALLYRADTTCRNVELIYILDKSVDLKKVIKLILNHRIKLSWLIQQFYARFRQNFKLSNQSQVTTKFSIASNNDLLELIAKEKITKLYGFRAGLVLGKKVLDRIPCYNIHAADTKKYPGLGAIAQAIAAGEKSQPATLHEMQIEIDSGKIIGTLDYMISSVEYWQIEIAAYSTGAKLLYEYL